MDSEIAKKITATFDHRRLNRSGSSLFAAFAASVIALIVFTVVIVSNLTVRDLSEVVKIEIKTVVPYLPLRSEKELSVGNSNYTMKKSITTVKENNNLEVLEVFGGKDVSEKFQQRVTEFLRDDDCEVNFMMTWISPVKMFGKREVLSVESVFKSHPRGCLIILSSTMDSPHGFRVLKPFLDRGYRVMAITPDLPFLLKDTAGESWLEEIQTGKRDPGKISLAQNLSNLMRLAYLFKFGGVYLDTDMIVLKSFKTLRNVIGAQTLEPVSRNWTRLNNAVLVFDKNHPLLRKCIEEFALTFNGNVWGHNGPYLVSRVARAVEGTDGYNNFTVMTPPAFYSVNWIEIEKLFKVPRTEKDSKRVQVKVLEMQRRSYGLHLWNKFSSKFEIEKGSAMDKIVSDHCVICEKIYVS
ncbi:hypothetical protein N665_0959s0014 [Sinapis alba]|nr:hypothetical protein N665_0959s0014 [Sinapis alba]